jgi:hypothetical protein
VANEVLEVDPSRLRVPPSRHNGADPLKLHRQIQLYGDRTDGMPLLWVARGKKGELLIMNGVTRATRIAKLRPGTLLQVLVTEDHPNADFSRLPTIGDVLP